MNPDKPKNNVKKIVFFIILTILIIVSATAGTIFYLNNTVKKEVNSVKSKIYSSNEMIGLYSKNGNIASLSASSYSKVEKTPSTVQYILDGYGYSVTLDTNVTVVYSALPEKKTNDTDTVQKQTDSLMNKYAMEKIDNNIDQSMIETVNVAYENKKTVCQLSSSPAQLEGDTVRFHSFSCIDKDKITEEYGKIEKLLSIYKSENSLGKFDKLTRYTNSEKNISYSIISLESNDKSQQLLFAAIDDSWEYLGDLSSGDKKYSNAKYTLTPEILSLINNPKYNGFISKEIN